MFHSNNTGHDHRESLLGGVKGFGGKVDDEALV